MKLAQLFILLIVTQLCSIAGGTGENVLLVVNADSLDSKTIANHYAKLRSIPREQILYLKGVNSANRSITSEQFRTTILTPIFKHIKESKQNHIDYIIYSSGFPYSIACAGDTPKGKKFGNTQNPTLSLTSATFYAEMILDKNMNYMNSGSNYLYNIGDTPQSFRSSPVIGKSAKPDHKSRHHLSFQLGTVSPQSSTAEQIITYLQTAKDADFTQPKGTFYFTKTGDIRSKCRLRQFAPIVEKLNKLGYQAEIINSGAPSSKTDVIGATIGTPRFNWPATKSTFMPGAIGDNLTSYGGILIGKSGQTPCTKFLNNGAAAACGTVIEPYAIAAKFPQASIHLHYVKGTNAAEAMYASVKDPFQLIMVGDALCQPYAKKFTIEVTKHLTSVDGVKKVAYTPTTNRPVAYYEIFIDGVYIKPVKKQFLLGINDITPGAHELRIVAVADDPLETRASYVKRIFLKKNMPHIKISTNKKTVKLGQTLSIKVYSPIAGEVSIYHNTQLLGKRKSGTIKIKADTLGLGKTELYGIIEKSGKKIRTAKIEVEVIK